MSATFVVEVLVGTENVSLTMKEHGEGIGSIDTAPLHAFMTPEQARSVGVAILTGLTMGEFERDNEHIGWMAWMANYVEGSALSDDLQGLVHSLMIGRG